MSDGQDLRRVCFIFMAFGEKEISNSLQKGPKKLTSTFFVIKPCDPPSDNWDI